MFYFLQKTQKFSKKGLGVSMCTHTAHPKFCFAGSVVKIVKFWILASCLGVCLQGANTAPSPFQAYFGRCNHLGCFPASFRRVPEILYFGHILSQNGLKRPQRGTCRNFCRYFEGPGHSTDVRTYLILCVSVYQVYLKNFNPLTPGCAPHCGIQVAETPKIPNFGRKSRFCRNFG